MSKLPAPLISSKVLLARLTRLTSTIPGLDASLMLVQYSSPIVISLLVGLAQYRTTHPRLNAKAVGSFSLAEGWGKAAANIGDARVIMRAFGLLPIIQFLFALHPNPFASLRSLLNLGRIPAYLSGPKAVPTLQVLALLCYYPLEHLAWLGSKGVVPLTPRGMGIAQLFSVRFWALYVMLEIYKLRNTYSSLNTRTRALRAAKPNGVTSQAEGSELQESGSSSVERSETSREVQAQEVKMLKKDWLNWRNAVVVNSGYAPLTMHWSAIGGLWTNPLITAFFGTMAAAGQWKTQWDKAESD